MPVSRYEIRNEYSLADPDLYGAADQNDPEALLEAVSMSGLVGLLRQLGDLAEFAAEIFHDLHEEVMATATRGHGLIVRVKQLEAEVPLIEKAFLSQASPSVFFSNAGTDWHPSPHTNQNLITGGDLPRFIMDSCEECRGPPRLFLLDKFDVAGAGACLKRYTDPSFFKVEASSYGLSSAEVQKEKRSRKSKKKGSRLRNAGTPEGLPASHAKLQQLFLEDRVENGVTDSARLVKLKRRLNRHPFDPETGKSFMEKFISVSSPEDKVVHEVAYGSSTLELPSQAASESGTGVSYLKESTSVEKTVLTPLDEVSEDLRVRELSLGTKQYPLEVVDEKEIAVDGESKRDGNEDDNQSDDVASEVDTYMDALATMEPEIETDTEFRSKYDIGFVDMEKQATDCDANEELLQVQSSDSQSTEILNASEDGNDSVKKGSSSFSYSDTGSTAAENMPVDVDVAAKVSPSTKFCEDEVTVMSTEKHSSSEELSAAQDYQPSKLDVSDDTFNEITNLPSYGSDSGDPCSSVHHSDSFPACIPLDEGVARGTLRGAQIVKISSNHDELDTKFIKMEENSRSWGNNIPWTSRHSSVPSQTIVDEPPVRTASAENHILEKLDGDLSVLPSASIHISQNNLEVIPKKHDDECSLNDLLEEDISTEDLIDSQISPRHSVISHADIKPSVPSVLDYETSNTVLQPEVLDSVDNVFPSAKSIIVAPKIASDSSYNSSVAEQQEAEWADDVPAIPIVSAFDASHEEETPTSVLPEADSGETGEIDRSISLIGSEATAVTIKSDHLYSGGSISSTGFPVPSKAADGGVVEVSSGVNLDGIEAAALANSLDPLNITGPGSLIDEKQTEVSQSENIIVAAIVANHDSDTDEVNFISKRNLHAEDFHCVSNPDQYGSEVYDEILPQNYSESVKQTAEVNQEAASPDLNFVRSEIDIGDHSDSEMVSYVPESSLQPVKTTAFSSSSIYSVQNTEPVSSVENNMHEHSGDTFPLSTHHFPEVSTLSKPELTLQNDQFDIEHLHGDESKPKEVSQSEQLSCSNHLGEGSSDAHSEPCFVARKSVVPVNLQADSLAVETLYGDKASFGSSSKLDLDHIDHGGNFITSPRPSSMTPISELSQLGSHEVDISAHATDELSAVRSDFLPLPELPQVSLPEMPPLPPLPPVQWRIGRAQQHSSLPSDRDSVQNTFGLFPPMFPSKTSNNTQMGYSTNRDDFLPSVPILPPLAVKDEDHQHVHEHLLGTTAHSSPLSMQMPLTSNNRSRDVPTSDRRSNTDPCLTLPSPDNESPGHRMRAGEAGSMMFSVTPSSIVTGADASYLSGSVPSHRSSQMQPEVCLEPESTSARSEVGLIKFSDTDFPRPTVADEHPKDVCTASEGETVRSTSNSLYPAIEDGTLNRDRPMKLLRPRSPLIDAVAAHDKSMLRKVTERSRPEVQKVEERDSLLEQIRAKSFNLKPAVVTRPSIQGPKTNLRVAAILEKANAIRQAFAGSDEDEDSWSDS